MSDIFVDNIKHQSSQGSGTITIGASGETIKAASGAQNNIGIGGCQMFILNAAYGIVSADTNELLTTWTDITNASFGGAGGGKIASLVSHSSGTFSFSETGVYRIDFHCYGYVASATSRYCAGKIFSTTDNSTYAERASGYFSISNLGTTSSSADATYILDVTDTTNVKSRMYAIANNAAAVINGSNTIGLSYVTFTRLGDT